MVSAKTPKKTEESTPQEIERKEDGTIVLTILLPWTQVEKEREKVIEELAKSVNLPGFRKGHAPAKLVEQQIDKDKVNEETLRKLIPEAYLASIKKHSLNPIISPHIHVLTVDEGKDWQFSASTAEAPKVELGNYQKAVKNVTAKNKIIIPGKPEQEVNFEELVKALLENVKLTIPEILITQEVDRLLSQTLNEVKSLGLSLEQYLASTGKTGEQLREEYKKRAENDVKLELILQKIAEAENITVNDKDIEEAINKAKDEKEKMQLSQNRYLLASILRQQKTFEFLKNL